VAFQLSTAPDADLGETGSAIDDWASLELSPWLDTALTREEVEARLKVYANRYPGVLLYRIDGGSVDFAEGIRDTHPHCLDRTNAMGIRAIAYRNLLQAAVDYFSLRDISILVGVHVNDLYIAGCDAPIFFFQKPRGTRGILVPDIDVILFNYFLDVNGEFADDTPFIDKIPKAIFAGSTTGDLVLTADHVVHNRNARIRAARFYLAQDDIIFELPNIVQCDTPETVDLIRSYGIEGRSRSWLEQLGYRYLISLDGNGATCSRVALALLSRSVLLKFNSDNLLYYFHGMQPWQHYIPVGQEQDIVQLLAERNDFMGSHARIAEQSRAFAEQFLSRASVLRYVASLLVKYDGLFGTGDATELEPAPHPAIDSATYVSGEGLIWTENGGWAGGPSSNPIEGFTLLPAGLLSEQIQYCGIHADGSPTEMRRGRQFCGDKGGGVPLHGMHVELVGSARDAYRVCLTGHFADGQSRSGEEIHHHAALSSFKISLEPQSGAGWWNLLIKRVRGRRGRD
jgi:hypothetical protein